MGFLTYFLLHCDRSLLFVYGPRQQGNREERQGMEWQRRIKEQQKNILASSHLHLVESVKKTTDVCPGLCKLFFVFFFF